MSKQDEVWTFQLFHDGLDHRSGAVSWVAILLETNDAHAPQLWHQYGGLACLHKQLRGAFVWVVCPAMHFSVLHMETMGEQLDTDTLAAIATLLPEGATLDSTRPAHEAIVPVKWHEQDAWLIWENSD